MKIAFDRLAAGQRFRLSDDVNAPLFTKLAEGAIPSRGLCTRCHLLAEINCINAAGTPVHVCRHLFAYPVEEYAG